MENQELHTVKNKSGFTAPQKILIVGLILVWLIALAGLVLGVRSLLSPLHSSVWLLVVWIIVELILSLGILFHLAAFTYALFDHANEHDDEEAGAFGVFLVFGAIAFFIASIALPTSQEFGSWSILNFILLSLSLIVDVVIWIGARNED